MKTKILITLVILFSLLSKVFAADIYTTGFEQPIFLKNGPLDGVDGWGAPPALSPGAASITGSLAKSGRQSVVVPGGLLLDSPLPGQFGPYAAIGSYRKAVDYTLTGNNKLARIDADLLLETKKPKTPGDFFSLTLAARSGDGETLGEVGLSSQGVAGAYGFNTAGTDPIFTRPIQFNRWHHITMLLDFANRTTSYFVDGHFLGAVPAPSASNVLQRGSMVVYARPDGDVSGGASSARSNYTAHFDNFRISVHDSRNAPGLDCKQ